MIDHRKIQVYMEWDPEMIYIIPVEVREGIRYVEIPEKGGVWKQVKTPYGERTDLKEVLKFNREDSEKLLIGLMKVLGSPGEDQLMKELKATQDHLEDMRKIVFKLFRIEA